MGLPEEEVRNLLREASHNHFRMYGTKPFELQYDPAQGEILRVTSTIGHVATEKFVVRLQPAIEGLHVAKCIGLAQACGYGFLSRYNDEIARQRLSEKEEYTAVDFFARSLLAAVTVVLRNGLDRKLSPVSRESLTLGGSIDFQATISAGKLSRPVSEDMTFDINTPPNRLLVTALSICKDRCRSRQVVGWANSVLSQIPGAKPYDYGEEVKKVPSSYFSVPRADYSQALLLSDLIIKGFSWEEGNAAGFLPLFTLDLDQLFEKYVSETIHQLLDPTKFSVRIQKDLPHPTRPPFGDKTFVPDLIISGANKQTRHLILDLKNKYGSVVREETRYASNPDVFQIAYYCHALKAKFAFLVYPGNGKNATRYPLKGSESPKAYEKRRAKAEEEIMDENLTRLFDGFPGVELFLFKWILNMVGSLNDTRSSVASLAQFAADLQMGVCNVA